MNIIRLLLIIAINIALVFAGDVYKCVKDNTRIYGNNKGQNYVGAWLDNGDYIYATGVSNGYAKFYKGYVSLSGLQKQTSTKTNYKVIAKDGLYFNSGPGTTYNSLILKTYDTGVVYYGRDWWENNWGVTNYGYCTMDYLVICPNSNCKGSSGGGSAGVYKCVKDNTRIYGNNKGQNYIGAWLDNGDYIYATGVSNGYAKFYKGYVSLSGLQKQTSTKTNYKVTKDGLNFNSGPGTNYNNLTKQKSGTGVVYYGRDWWENNWGVTNLGYCSMDYLTCTNCTNQGSCNDMSLFKTSLTRSQFINALKTYASSNSSLNLFANNAGNIYDISVANGLNPELVVVRAMSEGFSPGGYTYNYWGLSCYNLSNSCASYSSFSEGVRAFINNIKSNNYQTPFDMMKTYAFIGNHWYNPGSWSDGGCVYYPYIKQYMSTTRSNQVNYACTSGGTCSGYESNCLKTTQEDQNAYATWTSQKMIGDRNSVFNIKC